MSTTDPRGPARGASLSAFRCARAAEERHDDLAGTATHVNAFLLIEDNGPWGATAVRDSRLPEAVKAHLADTPKSLKVLLARRHLRDHRLGQLQVVAAFPASGRMLTTTLANAAALTSIDVAAIARGEEPDWEPLDGPIFAVCTHGKHDTCCAERGRPVAAALTESRPEQTWEVSHIGGDRFSGNMVVLPDGLYYGRLDPESAAQVALEHDSGRLDLTRLRGWAAQPMLVQYAEIALRRQLREDDITAIRLLEYEGGRCVFTRYTLDSEETYAVTVRRTEHGEAQLTCAKVQLAPLPRHETLAIEALPSR